MSYNYSNSTQFGIKNNVERYFYAGWFCFVFMCSLLGDSTILVASIKYKAFNLHKIVVASIEHIAVCDLLNALLTVLPTAVSILFSNGGSSMILNQARFFVHYYGNIVSAYLIAAMSCGKLLLLKCPLRTASWSKKQAYKICVGIWIGALCSPTLHLLIDKDDVTFDYRYYTGTYLYSHRVWNVLLPIMATIFLFIPNCIIIVSTVLLLKEARKVVRETEKNLRWQGILTVVLTATVYTISFLPATIYYIGEPLVAKGSVPGPFFVEFTRVAMSVLYFNVLANFFVYSLAVSSFRSFLKIKFQEATSFLLTTSLQQVKFNIFHKNCNEKY